MLFAIHKGKIEGYEGGQASILHLVTSPQDIANASLDFVFTDGHAVMGYTTFYNDLASLSEAIDWEIMESQYWNDTNEDGDRKRRRQAEFLVYRRVPWSLIRGIGVQNEAAKGEVNKILEDCGQTADVRVLPNYYY